MCHLLSLENISCIEVDLTIDNKDFAAIFLWAADCNFCELRQISIWSCIGDGYG